VAGEIVAVLVVPAEKDPAGLLAEGRCGWPPAVAWTDHQPDGWHWRVGNTRKGHALPLWWDGALVPEGWDRARRAWFNSVAVSHDAEAVYEMFDPTLELMLPLADSLVGTGLASRVARLTRDAEGRLVEVSDG
jgi:hypothetical protein